MTHRGGSVSRTFAPRPEITENDVEWNCINWLQSLGWIAERNPSGLLYTKNGDPHRVGRPGVCDWRLKRGVKHPLHYFELECKRPGEEPDKRQREYMAQMAAHGVVAVYADSLEMLQQWYEAGVAAV